jgi:ATP-dependent DNA helicase RecG
MKEGLVVLSFPGPDHSIKMADLRRGKGVSRRYRNRRIGEFLKELDLTEGRSTGISKILKAMKANGSPVPEFETDQDRTYFLIRLPVHSKAVSEKTTQKTTQKTDQKILDVLRKNPALSRREIADILGNITEDGVKYQLSQLKANGKIKRVGPDRGGHWEVMGE